MSIAEVVARCDALGCPRVTLTGGEPLEQAACPALAAALLEAGYAVFCETSGTVPIDLLPREVLRIMDLKCPSSGVCDRNHWPNIAALTERDEVKFVIGSPEDYDWACKTVAQHDLTARCGTVLFAPVYGVLDPATLAAWMLEDRHEVRLQVPLHKVLWPDETRGV